MTRFPVRRHHQPDEEPDVDERPLWQWDVAEAEHGADLCPACGHRLHGDDETCPCEPEGDA